MIATGEAAAMLPSRRIMRRRLRGLGPRRYGWGLMGFELSPANMRASRRFGGFHMMGWLSHDSACGLVVGYLVAAATAASGVGCVVLLDD